MYRHFSDSCNSEAEREWKIGDENYDVAKNRGTLAAAWKVHVGVGNGGAEGAEILSILTNNDTSFKYFFTTEALRKNRALLDKPLPYFSYFMVVSGEQRLYQNKDHVAIIVTSKRLMILFLAYISSTCSCLTRKAKMWKSEFYNLSYFSRKSACRVLSYDWILSEWEDTHEWINYSSRRNRARTKLISPVILWCKLMRRLEISFSLFFSCRAYLINRRVGCTATCLLWRTKALLRVSINSTFRAFSRASLHAPFVSPRDLPFRSTPRHAYRIFSREGGLVGYGPSLCSPIKSVDEIITCPVVICLKFSKYQLSAFSLLASIGAQLVSWVAMQAAR